MPGTRKNAVQEIPQRTALVTREADKVKTNFTTYKLSASKMLALNLSAGKLMPNLRSRCRCLRTRYRKSFRRIEVTLMPHGRVRKRPGFPALNRGQRCRDHATIG